MANDSSANLRVRISADLADIKQGLGVLRGDLAKVRSDAAKSAPDLSAWRSGLRQMRTELAGLAAAYLSLRSLRALASVSDEASNISARLRVATKSQEEFNRAQSETFAIAQRTRTDWQETASLYSRISQSAGSLGLGQEDTLKLTEAVSKALAISGATGEEAAGVMRQFGQALGNGRVQAEEFNSISDSGQRIVSSLARQLGIATSQVKGYVNAGKVSSRDLAQALLTDAASINQEYTKIPTTISGAVTQIRNAFVQYVGRQNEATGAAQTFSALLQQIARDLPAFFDPLLQATSGLAKAFRDAGSAADAYGDAAEGAASKTGFMAEAGQFLANVFRVLASAALLVKNAVEIVVTVIAALNDISNTAARTIGEQLGRSIAGLVEIWTALKDKGPVAAMEAYRKGVADMAGQWSKLPGRISDKVGDATYLVNQQIDDIRAGLKGLFDETAAAGDQAGVAVGGAGPGGTAAGSATGKAVAASNATLRDAVSRALQELDRLYAENEVSLREYFQTRQMLQQKSIDLDIAQAQAELAVTKDLSKRQALEDQLVKLQRDRADVAVVSARDQKKAEEELAKQLGDVKLQLMELDGDGAAAARARLEQQYQDLFKRLKAESDEAGAAMVHNLIDRLSNKAQLDQLKDVGSRITSGLQSTETSVSTQVSGGMLGYGEGEQQLTAARATALEQLQSLRAETAAYLATLSAGSPEGAAALAYLQQLDTSIAGVTASQQQFRQEITDNGASAFSNFIGTLADGATSFKDAFTDMVRSFLSGVAQMLAQALALRAIQSILGSFGGGAAGGGAAAVAAGVAHGGGVAGSVGRRRSVIPAIFAGAPRYHSGGIAGLAPDEVPAILQRGERVLSRRQTAAYEAARGGGSAQVTTPIVAIGDDAVANALAGASGEKVVVTHVRNNWGGLSRG